MGSPSFRTCLASSGENDSVRNSLAIFGDKASGTVKCLTSGLTTVLQYLLFVVPGENCDGMVKERSRELAKRLVDETERS